MATSSVSCDFETLVIRVPMKFKKRGGRKEIIVPSLEKLTKKLPMLWDEQRQRFRLAEH